MEVKFAFGTTLENASIALTYTVTGPIVGIARYTSPKLERALESKIDLKEGMTPDEVSKAIWNGLYQLEKRGRA